MGHQIERDCSGESLYTIVPTLDGNIFVLHREFIVREQDEGRKNLWHEYLIVDEEIGSTHVFPSPILQEEEKRY
jgi:hypothetical protein